MRSDHWKGMNEIELKAIKEIQENQKIIKRETAAEEKINNCQFKKNLNIVNYKLMENALLEEMRRKEEAKEYALYLKNQMKQKKQNDHKINEVYQNKVENSYYAQFNTSHR